MAAGGQRAPGRVVAHPGVRAPGSVAAMGPVAVSVVLPAYDESDNLVELLPELAGVLAGLVASGRASTTEVLVVDDGSRDGTRTAVDALGLAGVQVVRLRRNSGKSAALSVGLRRVTGDVVVLMDADGQDDPAEMAKLLDALDAGADLVTGQRSVRNDRLVKRVTSKFYNATTRVVTAVPGSDHNSGYKAMTAEVASSLELYGELHRYIPVLAAWQGFATAEVPVDHRARLHGSSKFGAVRFWRGFLDLITVKFLTQYVSRPFHLFGSLGIAIGAVGAVLLGWMAVLRVLGEGVGDRPALIIGVLCVVVAVQMVSLGLLAELIVNLRRTSNLDATVESP
jgi:glycosyltransferase involved in cell wall biosynthesis